MDQTHIRNFCIIAHIDHGKSTLADRLLELTGTTADRRGEAVASPTPILDSMDLERERGVTIKASAVRMSYAPRDRQVYQFNLIDTPGHVDFAYEVSRAVAACEGAVLVVDAAQSIQAQTLANLYLALDYGLEIVPVINKIDVAAADPERVAQEIEDLLAITAGECLMVSAREGTGVEAILEAVVERIPPPSGRAEGPLRALIFDAHYDPYQGVVAYVRVVDGAIRQGQPLFLMAASRGLEPMEIGTFGPEMRPTEGLGTGEVGYVATGLKGVRDCRVGDTLTSAEFPAAELLPGYRPVKPMVFAGLYPVEGEDYPLLQEALEKLQLNDASLTFQPESSQALGHGFRCGFLGLFHMEIVQERLEREYGVDLLATAPNVLYQVLTTEGEVLDVARPSDLPPAQYIDHIQEPWMELQVSTPSSYIGPLMELVTRRRGRVGPIEYLSHQRVLLHFHMPLSEMITDFYHQLKSRTRGYASLDYQVADYRPSDLVKMDILVNQEPVDALSLIVHRDQAYDRGKVLVARLKEEIPRQLFAVPIQAAIGRRVIARETVKALRKNVLAKCYGGDVTRKRKLLQRQREGKKRLKRVGQVEIPQEAFLAVLRMD